MSVWFKYPIIGASHLGRLLSNSNSNSDFCSWSSDSAFFIDPRIDKEKDRKNKIKNHHTDIINVFERLRNISFNPVYEYDGLYKTCIPLYFDVVRSFKSIDKYDEAIGHLNDPDYTVAFNNIIDITNLENDNNSAVSQFMSEKEKEIKDAISDNPNISLMEYTRNHKLRYYNLEMIFKYYISEIGQHRELEIVYHTTQERINYYQLHIDPSHVIAVGQEENLRNLKKLIDSKNQNITPNLQQFINNRNKMIVSINTFITNMESVVHDAKILGLKGKCQMEYLLGFFNYYGLSRVIRFFRRQILAIPSTYSSL
jgi:hypothetical protein